MLRIGLGDCPYCGSLDVFRSHPKNLMDRARVLLLLELARCHYCMQRYYYPLLMPPLREYPNPSPKKAVRAVTSEEIRKRTAQAQISTP
jgi:hypothetical protein